MNRINVPDHDLWTAVVNGDSSAFVSLYNRYWKRLYKTALYHLKDSVLAEEVVHDVFVVLWNRREFLKIEKFEQYIIVTLRYHVFKKLKAAKNSLIDYVEEYKEGNHATGYSLSTDKLIQADFETELNQYLQGLPKRCAEIFLLSRVKNMSNLEISGLLNISKFTVENQITYALKYLRTKMKENKEAKE